MIDLDGIACPVGLDPRVPDDGEELIDYLTAMLPPEFHDASCYWQWSASQSVPERLGDDHPDQLRAHLFFWLDRAAPDGELRRWATRLKRAGLPVDPAVFAPVQPHYIAAPVFDGLPDPLSRRSGFRERSVDAVPLVLPPADPPEGSADTAHDYDGSGLQFHLGRIGPEGYQAPIKATIAAFFAEHGADADAAPVKADIRTRIAEASREYPRTPLEIERYRSDRFLDDKITWTRARERAAGAAASAACASLPPCFGDEAPERDAVLAAQRVAIREWLTRNHGIARARREIARRRRQALGDAGIVEDPPDFNRESREIRRRKAAITRRVRAELGLDRLPRQGERTLVTGAQGTGKNRAVAESIAQMEGIVVLRWLVASPAPEASQEPMDGPALTASTP